MDFVFDLPKDSDGNTGVVVFVDRLSKMARLEAVPDTIDGKGTATLYLDRVVRHHGLPESIKVFEVLGTKLDMSMADHPQTDGQTERANRYRREDTKALERYAPLVEFPLNIAVHAPTGFTPFYLNSMRHPRVLLTPSRQADWLEDISPAALRKQMDIFLSARLSILRHVHDAMAESQDVQKEHVDAEAIYGTFMLGIKAKNFPTHAVLTDFKMKLHPRFIGPFTVVAKKGMAYTLDLPSKMQTHPVFYVGLVKPYRDSNYVSSEELAPAKQSPEALIRQASLMLAR
ncbi:hypothetical protein PHMEG_00023716 [Phytophthora megakarya]|uniref:Tf2-1-like SH3-like domain-containing protein n=1 Tax=Phytophthora megakarya TaxID=4795 RepID=A0A225VHY0_9STRA|nr:hypothetical protein PHMEG_00023716 [Phytophthora megakarya]